MNTSCCAVCKYFKEIEDENEIVEFSNTVSESVEIKEDRKIGLYLKEHEQLGSMRNLLELKDNFTFPNTCECDSCGEILKTGQQYYAGFDSLYKEDVFLCRNCLND